MSAVEWLDAMSPWPRDGFGVDRMQRLLAALGDPQQAYPAIHVVGTNGKSTATVTIERLATNASAAPVVLDIVDDGASYWVHQRGVDRAVVVEKAHLDPIVTVERDKLVKHAPPSTSQAKPAHGGAHSG